MSTGSEGKKHASVDYGTELPKQSLFRFADLHVHTTDSDGSYTVREVLQNAVKLGIGYLSFTNHNIVRPDGKECKALSREYGIELIPGCEFSAQIDLGYKKKEIHVNGFWIDPKNPKIREVLAFNRNMDRSGYIKAYLKGLAGLGIWLTDDKSRDLDLAYRQLVALHPESVHIGRQALAERMEQLGYCSREEAFHRYLGRRQDEEKMVYIRAEDYFSYAPLEQVIQAIRSCPGAISCLNHPYYQLDADHPDQMEQIIRQFAELGGDAMEVFYADYSRMQQIELMRCCREYGLLPSVGSDHHNDDLPLKQGEYQVYRRLYERHQEMLAAGNQVQ